MNKHKTMMPWSIAYTVFTWDTFTWGKCNFTIENVTQYNRNVNLLQVNVSRALEVATKMSESCTWSNVMYLLMWPNPCEALNRTVIATFAKTREKTAGWLKQLPGFLQHRVKQAFRLKKCPKISQLWGKCSCLHVWLSLGIQYTR